MQNGENTRRRTDLILDDGLSATRLDPLCCAYTNRIVITTLNEKVVKFRSDRRCPLVWPLLVNDLLVVVEAPHADRKLIIYALFIYK